jgi:hypothetical protein
MRAVAIKMTPVISESRSAGTQPSISLLRVAERDVDKYPSSHDEAIVAK